MGSLRDTLNNLARDYAIAWSSGDPEAVASFFAPEGQISVNRGETLQGHAAIAEMARAVYSDFLDLEVRCDMMRWAGPHALFVRTLEGLHSATGNRVVVRGWEQWELTPDNKIQSSLEWFDADDFQRQIDGK
ncbi:nuclear transport factor 2 family protein [uncultured Ruegeria sp.]|uniref:nuclear transport factor 2 family protein n=1 Tax=uncultured Ruegeria sp. TaxID=259304 RepID=UPI00263620C9|nr:nuclear transport factor 2 family protein [uncultured Ruegeria sp.]